MILRVGRSLAHALAASLVALCVGAIQAQPKSDDGYTYAEPVRGSTGKFFMGRPIANIVDTGGAHWFDRPEREQEEGTGKLIPLLCLKPTDVVADIGAGTGYFSIRLARAVPEGKVFAQDIQAEMLRRHCQEDGGGHRALVGWGHEEDPVPVSIFPFVA